MTASGVKASEKNKYNPLRNTEKDSFKDDHGKLGDNSSRNIYAVSYTHLGTLPGLPIITAQSIMWKTAFSIGIIRDLRS